MSLCNAFQRSQRTSFGLFGETLHEESVECLDGETAAREYTELCRTHANLVAADVRTAIDALCRENNRASCFVCQLQGREKAFLRIARGDAAKAVAFDDDAAASECRM